MASQDQAQDPRTFANFDEFWRFYVKEHQNPWTRRLHFAGTTAAVGTLVAAAVLKKPSLVLVAAVAGYGPAWAAHFLIEGNMPATFKHPLWSARADFVMWKKMVMFQMDDEVARIVREDAEAAAADPEAAATAARVASDKPDDTEDAAVSTHTRVSATAN